MKISSHNIYLTIPIAAAIIAILGGCTKKTVQVSPFPERAPVTAPVAVPTVAEPVDSTTLLEALLREALQNVYFDFNEYRIRTDATDQLKTIAKILMEHQKVSIMIDGHCDKRSSSEYNMALGENRAIAMKNWLVAYGIADAKIQTNSYGKEHLAVEGCSDEVCYQKNRRCEFKINSLTFASY